MTGAFAVLIAALSGCDGANEPKFELVPVRGNVTLNGQPLADAQVSFWFQGTSPKGYTGSGGKTDAQGNFELTTLSQKGTIVGKHKAVVSKMTMKDGSPLQVAEGMDEQQLIAEGKVVESIPPPFNDPTNTPVAFEVTKDKTDGYDIKITK
jgi:hypothetical protein